jgi:hypothetical protein
VAVVRPAPNATDWDLPVDSRTQVKKLLELGKSERQRRLLQQKWK